MNQLIQQAEDWRNTRAVTACILAQLPSFVYSHQMKLLIIIPPNEGSKHNLSIPTMFLYYIEIDLQQEKAQGN